MRIVTYKCDVCGREVEKPLRGEVGVVAYRDGELLSGMERFKTAYVDLCARCADRLEYESLRMDIRAITKEPVFMIGKDERN